MEIIHAIGIDGARRARGLAVVIDVLRSFTVSAYALAGGARECRLVTTTDEARALRALTPDSVICAEEDGPPGTGSANSNTPTQNVRAPPTGGILGQMSTAGTTGAVAVRPA